MFQNIFVQNKWNKHSKWGFGLNNNWQILLLHCYSTGTIIRPTSIFLSFPGLRCAAFLLLDNLPYDDKPVRSSTQADIAHCIYCVDLQVWSKFAKCVCLMCITSKCARHFYCDWQRVNMFSHCVTLTHILLSQIISYSDTKVPVLVVMECKRANVVYVYELIFLLHTSRSTESNPFVVTVTFFLICTVHDLNSASSTIS